MDGGRVLSPGCHLEGGGWVGGGGVFLEVGWGLGRGRVLYGVCSICLTGSLSCQQWGGITCSPVSARHTAPFKYTSK